MDILNTARWDILHSQCYIRSSHRMVAYLLIDSDKNKVFEEVLHFDEDVVWLEKNIQGLITAIKKMISLNLQGSLIIKMNSSPSVREVIVQIYRAIKGKYKSLFPELFDEVASYAKEYPIFFEYYPDFWRDVYVEELKDKLRGLREELYPDKEWLPNEE